MKLTLHHIEAGARLVLIDRLGIEPICKTCSTPFTDKVLASWRAGKYVYCVKCGWQGNWRQGTALGCARITNAQTLLADFALAAGADPRGVASVLGLKLDTVKRLKEKLAAHDAAQSGAPGAEQ